MTNRPQTRYALPLVSVAAMMAAQLSAEMEKAQGTPVTIETAILQRVLETHVREQLDALADLRVSLA